VHTERPYRREHACAGGHPVVDHDDGLAVRIGERAVAAVGVLAPGEFGGFPFDHGAHLLVADAQAGQHMRVHHHAAATGQRAHRQLRPLRHAELADQKDIQLCPQRGGDLPTDRYAATGQPEDQ